MNRPGLQRRRFARRPLKKPHSLRCVGVRRLTTKVGVLGLVSSARARARALARVHARPVAVPGLLGLWTRLFFFTLGRTFREKTNQFESALIRRFVRFSLYKRV